MKINCVTILMAVLLTAAAECNAQWTPVYQDMDAYFYDAAFPTDYTGYVAATDTGGAVILRTNDGGATWNKRYIPGLSFINKIEMIDSLRGYIIAAGVPVKLIRTTDGFATFTGHPLDSSYAVQSLCILNDSTGFYLNNASRLRKFEHYGASYIHVMDTLTSMQSVQFVNATTGYLDTGYGLVKTTDAGATWNYVNTSLGFYCVEFNFADPLNGYFSDLNSIFITHDGGVTFPQPYNFSDVSSFATNGNFCIAANDTGNVAYTFNGGSTWQTETTGINWIVNEPYKVAVTPGRHCFLFSQFCGEIRKRELLTGVENAAITNPVEIFPNPFTASSTIYFGEQQNDVTVRIVDILGKEIETMQFTGKQLTIHKDEMPAGIYCVQITGEDQKVTSKKIIIQ